MLSGSPINRFALTEFRLRSGYNKAQLARAVGISPAHMSDVEGGKRNPSPELIARFAGALKVPVPALLANPREASA